MTDDERYPAHPDPDQTCAHSICEDEPNPSSTEGLCTWHMGVEDGEW